MTAATGDSRTLKRFAKLDKLKRELKKKIEANEADLKEVEPQVINYFQRMGMDNAKIDGVTIYLRRELWAGKNEAISSETFHDALTANGLGDYVKPKVNTQQLSAYVRELDARGEKLPVALEGIIKTSEVFKVGTRKS